MKLSLIGGVLISAMSLAPSAHAAQHGGASATIKAVFDYCSRIDERNREQYARFETATLASITGNDPGDYQAVYTEVSEQLNKAPEATGRKTCVAGIPAALRTSGSDKEREDRR